MTTVYKAFILHQPTPHVPILSVEVLQHRCEVIRKGSRFEKIEHVDTVYNNLFSIEQY